MLAFGDFGAKRRVILASEQFVNYVKVVQQQAILETGTLGIWVDTHSYQAMYFDASSHWKFFPANSIFRKHDFPSQTSLQLQSQIAFGKNPQIVINDSGDMNAFTLMIRINETIVAQVIGHQNGAIALETKFSS